MKVNLSKTEARAKIDSFFHKTTFTTEDLRKIKRIAMKYNIKLGEYRKYFCKKCNSKLKGKILNITKTHKTIQCSVCNYKNKFKLI